MRSMAFRSVVSMVVSARDLRAVTFGPELDRGRAFTEIARLDGVRREMVWPTTRGTPGFRRVNVDITTRAEFRHLYELVA